VETARLEIDFNAGSLVMSSLPLSSQKLVEAVSRGENGAKALKAEVDLVAFEVDERRFLKKGDYYVTGDFDSASNRIELEIDCDAGRVQLK